MPVPTEFGSARNSRERQGVNISVAAEASPLDRHRRSETLGAAWGNIHGQYLV